MSEAAAAAPPPPPPPPPSPPRWGIISSVPRVVEDDAGFLLGLFDILPPPSISHITLPRRSCPMEMTTDDFPRIISVDPMGLFLLYIPRSPDLTVCLPDKGAGDVETVPYPSSPPLHLGNTGIISYYGFSRTGAYAICELVVHSSDCATLRWYSTESKKWIISTEHQCDGVIPEDWGKSGCARAISHNRKLWWIDLRYGIITCDPFAQGFLEKLRDPFVELQQLHFIPLPGPAVLAESLDDLDKLRCVKVSSEKLRYALLQPCATHVQAPVVNMWTLDDPDAALWSLQYTVLLSEVPSVPLAGVTPKLALIHPLDPNVLYFFKDGWIFAVNALSRKVIHSEQYDMVYPPEQHHCSSFVYAYQPLRKELAGVRDCAAPSKLSSGQENPSAGIETVGKIAESYQGNNISHGDNGNGCTEAVGILVGNRRGNLISPVNFCSAPSVSQHDPMSSVHDKQLLQQHGLIHEDVDVGVFSQSCVFRDNPASSAHGQQLAQQGHGNDCTETVGNTSHGGKLITPVNFCSETLLSESAVHLFKSAQDLRNSVDSSTSEWLANEQAWAMLKNPSIFQVTGGNDDTEERYRTDGSCMLVDHNLLQKFHPTDKVYSTRKKQLKEKAIHLKVFGTKLCQHTMKGNVWERRRLSIKGDDAFSVIQWRARLKMADGGQARRRGCEEPPAKGVHSNELPPAKPGPPRRTHDAEAGASKAPQLTKDAEVGLPMDERISKLEAGQQIMMRMLERMDKKIDHIAQVLTTAPSQPPPASAQDRRPPIHVEANNRDEMDHRGIHRRRC